MEKSVYPNAGDNALAGAASERKNPVAPTCLVSAEHTGALHLHDDAEAKLDACMKKIQGIFKMAVKLDTRTRSMQYKGLSELLVFHIEADSAGDYLDKYYQEGGKKHKRKVNHGINFAPLITAAWPAGETLDTNKKNRWSRAMNGLLSIYKSDLSFRTGTAEKLYMLLTQDGLDKYVAYGIQKSDNEEEKPDCITDAALVKSKQHQLTTEEIKKLYSEGVKHMVTGTNSKQAKLSLSIPLGDNAMSLVLLRNMGGDEYAVLGATASDKYMKKFIAEKYASNINATPKALRVIYEAISTQCPPNELSKIYSKLIDKAGNFSDGSAKSSIRRLFYKHSTQQFIMSPIRARSGVVTVVTPKVSVLKDVSADVVLSSISRRKLEEKVISPRKFMRFLTNNLDELGLIKKSETYSHEAVLIDQDDPKKIQILFDYEDTRKEALSQVIVNKWNEKKAQWSAKVPATWIQTFENNFTSKWLESHGKHAGREHQRMLELEFGSKSIKVRFFEKDEEFDLATEVQLSLDAIVGKGAKVRVLSKDFAVAMHALSHLCLIDQVCIFVNSSFVAIKYETEVSASELYIPLCDEDGERETTGFGKYRLEFREPDVMDLASAQSEQEVVEAL